MPRETLDENLNQLDADLLLMAGMVENAIVKSLEALREQDPKLAERIIADDDILDERATQMEEVCIELIRREAPIAGDLRRLVSVMQMVNELERIGDYAEGIAKLTTRMGGKQLLKQLEDIPRMVETTLSMLKDSLQIHSSRDVGLAETKFNAVYEQDDVVDKLYEKVVIDLMTYMRQDADNIERATYLLWTAHNIERMADRTVNIAERAYYEIVGKLPPNR